MERGRDILYGNLTKLFDNFCPTLCMSLTHLSLTVPKDLLSFFMMRVHNHLRKFMSYSANILFRVCVCVCVCVCVIITMIVILIIIIIDNNNYNNNNNDKSNKSFIRMAVRD